MSKNGVIRCLLTLLLAVYLGFALFISNDMAAAEQCTGVDVRVLRTDGGESRGYMTVGEIRNLLKEWAFSPEKQPLSAVDMQRIEDKLNGMDNVEETVVERMPDGKVRVTVTPMIPVARVFDNNGRSYYINRAGKQLSASARFRIDVPIITGSFNEQVTPASLIPLMEHISADPAWNAVVAQVQVEPKNHDVILVPMIRGHVINLGDTSNISDKLERVMLMYHKVLPLKGWQFYDTISVKWGGQIVATRRLKSIPEPLIQFDTEGDADEDVNSMLTAKENEADTVSSDARPLRKPS